MELVLRVVTVFALNARLAWERTRRYARAVAPIKQPPSNWRRPQTVVLAATSLCSLWMNNARIADSFYARNARRQLAKKMLFVRNATPNLSSYAPNVMQTLVLMQRNALTAVSYSKTSMPIVDLEHFLYYLPLRETQRLFARVDFSHGLPLFNQAQNAADLWSRLHRQDVN